MNCVKYYKYVLCAVKKVIISVTCLFIEELHRAFKVRQLLTQVVLCVCVLLELIRILFDF